MADSTGSQINVRVGNVSIPIFKWGDGRHWVRWREDGEIQKRPFKTLEKAKALARIVATRLNKLWLRGLGVGLRRRNNLRDEVVTFFLAAKKAGHLPEDRATEAEKVDRVELDEWTPGTYTPAELRLLLEHVTREWLPWLCLGAFAGMRPEEIACVHESKRGEKRQLMWSDFKWERRKIDLPAMIAKDRRRRLVPISDQLMAWLEPWTKSHGPVCPTQRLNPKNGKLVKDRYDREIERVRLASGVDWKNDGLRHSFCSFWLSLHHDIHDIHDIHELARSVGNSPSIIKKHYEDAKHPEEAHE